MNDAVSPVPGSLSSVVAAAAPLVCAIRTGPSRHITGLVCERDAIVTIAQALPVQDRHFVVLPNRLPIAALPGPRDPTLNLAVLRLDTTWPAVSPTIAQTAVGNMANDSVRLMPVVRSASSIFHNVAFSVWSGHAG